jgi:outer membrane receptor for ferrienterochelin and colicins
MIIYTLNRILYTFIPLLLSLCISNALFAQAAPPEIQVSIEGQILADGEPVAFATVTVHSTTLGTASDLDGNYKMGALPAGRYTLVAQAIGYRSCEKTIIIQANMNPVINFELTPDVLGLEQVVVTADRNERKRTEASVIVNTLTPKLFENTQSITLSEGLNYSPGLRMETNCQNCGFTQLRMNGMEGPYTQILINSRPIFSGLAGVYGLELIPANMIERIEVVRGGGSALYGSNAIAGTVNLITKDPIQNAYEIKMQHNSVGVGTNGNTAPDYALNFNTSLINEDKNTGLALFGFYRDKEPYDANKDDFSEISSLNNLTFGARFFHRPGYKNKITGDFVRINESRRGGNKFDVPHHEADISEAVDHYITTGALSYEHFLSAGSHLSLYASSQHVDRGSYYGANQSISDYGQSEGFTYTTGAQFKSDFGYNSLLVGIEHVGDFLVDKKLGYPDYSSPILDENDEIIGFDHIPNSMIADQKKYVSGTFFQYDRTIGTLKASAGLRYDYYNIKDAIATTGDNNGHVVSPRVNLLWSILPEIQWRGSYSQGYRAPQIFDEDLHIASSGSRQVIHQNDPNLKQETSYSWTTSLNMNKQSGSWNLELMAEAFYTKLNQPFVTSHSDPDEHGVVIATRKNTEKGAIVQGVNLETTITPRSNLFFTAGFTFQSSHYEEQQEDFGKRNFYRTPNNYGFFTIDWDLSEHLCLISNATYTGNMLIPYWGPNAPHGVLRTSKEFFDLGIKAEYTLKLGDISIQTFAGIKNIFNAYQTDFDTGIDRDPAYMYGPAAPRTIFFGLKISNLL